jgi:dTDP-4-dehydrorhamnose 3,5-epimerase
MNIIPLGLQDALIIENDIYYDERGYFTETFNFEKLIDIIGEFNIMQANQSKSKQGVIRGLHYQIPPMSQAKLVHVIKGEVLDVIVDLRKDSSTFGQHASIILNGTNKNRLFVPKGFAHGFITLSKDAILQYYVDGLYAPNFESGIKFDDKTLNIDWRKKRNIIVSEKDQKLKSFDELEFYTKAEFNYKGIMLHYNPIKIICNHENTDRS